MLVSKKVPRVANSHALPLVLLVYEYIFAGIIEIELVDILIMIMNIPQCFEIVKRFSFLSSRSYEKFRGLISVSDTLFKAVVQVTIQICFHIYQLTSKIFHDF